MKVLKNNYNQVATANGMIKKSYPRKLICEKCNSELQYDEEDVHIGAYGASHVLCPLCNYDNMLDGDEYDITLTKDNIEFPTHFYHTSVETGAVDNCTTEYIKNYVKEAISYFRNNKDEFAVELGNGTTMVHVFRYSDDNEYKVVVSKDHYNTFIPFESEDYGGNENYCQTYILASRG